MADSDDEPSVYSEVSGENDHMNESLKDNGDTSIPEAIREISFGALVDAQQSLDPNGKDQRKSSSSISAERQAELKARLDKAKKDGLKLTKSIKSNGRRIKGESEGSSSRRTSKHAPTSQSSARPVSRFRPAVELAANPQNLRDPRFSSVSTNATLNEDVIRKNYAFLSSYRDNEAADMKAIVAEIKLRAKKRKSKQLTSDETEEIDRLKRNINKIENKKKSEEKRAKEREVIRRHRKEEREQIKQGKNPFYLKRGEAKKLAGQEIFNSLKGREKKKLLERREKRKTMKERRGVASTGLD